MAVLKEYDDEDKLSVPGDADEGYRSGRYGTLERVYHRHDPDDDEANEEAGQARDFRPTRRWTIRREDTRQLIATVGEHHGEEGNEARHDDGRHEGQRQTYADA